MSIVLNEYEWAEAMLANCTLGKKPVETLSRISKYYYSNHYSKKDIRRLLDQFVLQCDPTASLVRWSDTLDRIAKGADRYPLICLDGISVTDHELKTIESLSGKQLRRLAFVLLCSAKYYDAVSESNNHWANSSDHEIMQMANINTSVKRQSAMYGELMEAGLIRFSKKVDNLNVQVLFTEDGETEMYIRDFRNLGYQYLKHYGGTYFECVNCGITVKERNPSCGRKQKYCDACAAEISTRQSIESVIRRRTETKS